MNERAPPGPTPRGATTKRVLGGRNPHEQLLERALVAHRGGDLAQAAELFEQSLHFAEATICWFEAQQFTRAVRAVTRVPRHHGMFRASASAAFKSALALQQSDPYLDRLLPYLESEEDADTTNVELARSFAAYKQMRLHSSASKTERVPRGDRRQDSSDSLQDRLDDAMVCIGETFAGRYQLRHVLGMGASATVFLAHDAVIDSEVALKIMSEPLNPEARERIRREIKLARMLTHESIVRVFDLVVAGEVLGISMEAVDGSSLAARMDEARLRLAQALKYLLQAARALSFAHERGVVHRDVKPENMLLTSDGKLKISDFGIAKMAEGTSITRTGMLLGTPHYIAPEQIEDFRKVDYRADVYALGVVAYELVTGSVPFDGPSVLAILTQHVNSPAIPPAERVPEIPDEVSKLVMAMLEKNPVDRIASCDAVVQALRELGVDA